MQRRRGHKTCRRKSRPLNTSRILKKGGIRKKPVLSKGKTHKKKDSPAIRRRWTSWSKLRATGWSHGNVLAQFLNSSCVQRLSMARRHSLPIGSLWSNFSMSNRMAIGTVYNTNDCSEFTILTAPLNKTGMSYIKGALGFYRLVPRT